MSGPGALNDFLSGPFLTHGLWPMWGCHFGGYFLVPQSRSVFSINSLVLGCCPESATITNGISLHFCVIGQRNHCLPIHCNPVGDSRGLWSCEGSTAWFCVTYLFSVGSEYSPSHNGTTWLCLAYSFGHILFFTNISYLFISFMNFQSFSSISFFWIKFRTSLILLLYFGSSHRVCL